MHMEQSRLQRSIPLVVAAQAEWMKGKIIFCVEGNHVETACTLALAGACSTIPFGCKEITRHDYSTCVRR